MATAYIVVEPGVIWHRPQPGFFQPRGDAFDFTSRRAVNDARFPVVAFENFGELTMELVAAADAVRQVRTIERSHQLHRRRQVKLGDDVAADALGRRGGERMPRDAAELVAQRTELAVFGPEIMTP